ncbi:MAG: carboxymuconolactone decarboxylase family protein [Sphingobium sp.]
MASPRTTELLAAVRQKMGGVPNLLATLAQSHAALGAYLGISGALSDGLLDSKLREQIALAVAGVNRCDYCASAHTVLAGLAGVSKEEAALNLRGEASDAKARVAVDFATAIVADRGHVADIQIAEIREAGFSDGEIAEIIAHVAMNIFTNYFNHIAGTDIDFPVVSTDGLIPA